MVSRERYYATISAMQAMKSCKSNMMEFVSISLAFCFLIFNLAKSAENESTLALIQQGVDWARIKMGVNEQ